MFTVVRNVDSGFVLSGNGISSGCSCFLEQQIFVDGIALLAPCVVLNQIARPWQAARVRCQYSASTTDRI